MARKTRKFTKTELYHVILRGNNQQIIFYDDFDYQFFINRLLKYKNELKIDLFGYCLMTNHVHILIGKASNSGLSLLILKLATSYAIYFNHKYDRTGHVFQGRFKSECIENEEYFKTVLRYILQNPDKNHTGKYNTYRWNSFSKLKLHSTDLNFEYIFNLFDNEKNCFTFISELKNDKCMEYENKGFISDLKFITILKTKYKIKNPMNLHRLRIDDQLQKIRLFKSAGFSINQISRVTGISKKIIKTA